MTTARPRSTAVWTLLALLVFQGLGAVGGGAVLVASPSGRLMHMPVENLSGSPFHDFLIPGLILLLVLGVVPLAVAAGLWLRQAWAWYGAFAVGCALVIFEIVEMLSIPFSPAQPSYLGLGVVIAGLSLLPPVRRHVGGR